jgi:NTP pyrophosphatase (non-canonical NTP hydrolase)
MTDQIQRRALETWYEYGHPLHFDRIPSTLGLVGEAGEFADLVKKNQFKPNNDVSYDDFVNELGDVLYYVAILAHQIGMDLEGISKANYAKLQERERNGNGYNRGIET